MVFSFDYFSSMLLFTTTVKAFKKLLLPVALQIPAISRKYTVKACAYAARTERFVCFLKVATTQT